MAVPLAAIVVAGGAAPRAGILAIEPVPAPPRATPQPAVLVPDMTGALAGGASTPSGSRAPALRPELAQAYAIAVAWMPTSCHLRVSVLAAMGQVGSRSLQDHDLDHQHRAIPSVYGERQRRPKAVRAPDTDGGTFDGDARWDRPVGPLAFLVPTWRVAQVDGDGDGRRDPQDIEDAAVSAARLLCIDGTDLGITGDLRAALGAFGHSTAYTQSVLRWINEFDAAERAAEAGLLLSMVDLGGSTAVDAGVGLDGSTTAAELRPLAAMALSTPTVSTSSAPEVPPSAGVAPTPSTGRTPAPDGPGGVPTGDPTPHETPTSRPSATEAASPPPAPPAATPSSGPSCTPGIPVSPLDPPPSAEPTAIGEPASSTVPSPSPADGLSPGQSAIPSASPTSTPC
jgi:hypothetical protein